VVVVFLTASFFGTRGLMLKYLYVKKDIDGVTASLTCILTDGALGVLFLLYTILTSSTSVFDDFSSNDILLAIFGGIMSGFGILFISIAATIGLIGPVYALAQFDSVLMILADWSLLNQAPGIVELLGSAVSFIGATLVAVGNDIIEYLYQKQYANLVADVSPTEKQSYEEEFNRE